MNSTRKTLFRMLFITLLIAALGAFVQTGQSASQFSPDPLPTIQVTLPPGVDWVTVRDLNVETTTIWQENGQVFGISSAVINSAQDAAFYQELIEGRLNSLPDEQILTAEVTFKDSLSIAGIESLLGQYTIISLLASGEGGSTRQVAYPPDDVPAELQIEFGQVFEALSGGTPAPSLSPDNYIAVTVKANAILLRDLAQKERVFTVDVGPVDLISDFPTGNFSSLKDVSYDYELHVGSSCEFTLLRNRINELSTNGEIPAAVRDELNGILTNSEIYINANNVASARSEMALFFETLTENSTIISENALKEADIVGDCLVVRDMQSNPVVNAGSDQTVQAGNSVTVNATYSDADNSEGHSARIDWGDGTIEDVPVNITSPDVGEVTGQHTYTNPINYTVQVCVTDIYGGVGCDTISVTVTPIIYTLVLQPDGTSGIDTYILSSSATSNYGTATTMGVGEDNSGNNKVARSLIKFDLSSIPSNATITSATLSLWTSQDLSSNTRTIRVYRLKRAFNETEATWNKATSSISWQTVGASGANDRESTDIGSVQILDNVPLNIEKQIILTPAKLQEMRNGTFTNNGFIIVADTENNDRFHYKTSDNTTATQRPKLVIQYTVPSTPDSIFADGFESGDFSHWSDSDWESGNLTVSTQSAAVGNKGMQAVITDTGSMQAQSMSVNTLDSSDPFYFNPNSTNTPHGLENLLAGTSDMAVYDTTPNDEKHYDARFYFDPNSINLPNGQGMYLFAGPNAQWTFCLYLERQGIYYRLSLCGKDDSDNWLENKFVYINDGWQAIEIEWQAANAPGANNGYMKLFINNVLVDTMKNLDTDTRSITDVALGVSGVPVGTTGTVYFDAFDSRRSSHIGLDANGPALQPPLTNLVFEDGFESGDLSSWAQSQLITDGGDLSVSSSAAMFGSYGLQALIDDTNVIYTKDFSPAAETHYSARVYFDPHSVTIANGQSFYIFANDNLRIRLKNNNGTYQLRTSIYNDSGAWIDGASLTISNSRQLLEVEWKAATASGVNDGYLKFWINDSLVDTLSSVDNDTRVIENINVGAGATYVIPSGTSGTIYFDSFESRNGGHIGP